MVYIVRLPLDQMCPSIGVVRHEQIVRRRLFTEQNLGIKFHFTSFILSQGMLREKLGVALNEVLAAHKRAEEYDLELSNRHDKRKEETAARACSEGAKRLALVSRFA